MRARSKEHKQTKRLLILEAAKKIIDKSGFSSLTIDQVVQNCRFSKGTFYIYFKSREEIILEILKNDFEIWFDHFKKYLAKSKEPFDSDFIKFWLKEIQKQPRLLSGLAYLHAALEPDSAEELIYQFKNFLFDKIRAVHYQIVQRFSPFVSIETLSHFLLIFTGVSVGLKMQSITSIPVKNVFEKYPDLRILRGDFEFHFKLTAQALVESSQFQALRQLTYRTGD